ncbi:E3 ISG15--protein ligase herc5 [Coelomomyces lativittatus]|nr:E3 ISG15--protein ligase herc5 [Coelomomyces lativittatus]
MLCFIFYLYTIETNELYVWGRNVTGILGLGHKSPIEPLPQPLIIEEDEPQSNNNKNKNNSKREKVKIETVSIGDNHMVLLSQNNGMVYSCGSNDFGQLGHGMSVPESVKPTLIESLKYKQMKVVQIATGANHTMVLMENGEVLTFGLGDNYRLGHGDLRSRGVPRTMETIPRNIVQIASGDYHSAALTDGMKMVC